MSTIPTTGVNLWCVTSPYPWAGDPNFPNAWIADPGSMDSTGSVGTWSPHKGSVPLVQSTGGNKPTFSRTLGSGNRGELTFVSANSSHMTGDGLASQVTGKQPWTVIVSLALTAVAANREVFSFSSTSDTKSAHVLQPDNSSPNKWRVFSADDGTATSAGTADIVCDTSHVVITTTFTPGAPNAYSMRINQIQRTVTPSIIGTFGTLTLSRFTVGAYRGSGVTNTCSMKLRALLYSPLVLTAQQVSASEKYLISEAA